MAERDPAPALLLVGHGSRSTRGVDAYWEFAAVVRDQAPWLRLGCGFLELASPDLATAIDEVVGDGATSVVAVPLVLLGAGHMKNDGPDTLARARLAHPAVSFAYGRALGVHPTPLAVAGHRIAAATDGWPPEHTAVVIVGRGSSDPDANGDLFKVARLLWGGGWADDVEASFVSLAPPSVGQALERCRRLGASRIAVVPYFLFTGVLVERLASQALAWAEANPSVEVRVGREMGPDPAIAALVLERYAEARRGDVRMNCDCCTYRAALPGFGLRQAHVHTHPHVGD